MAWVLPGAIIGDGDHNELSFVIARANPCEVRFGLFLAQLHNAILTQRALNATLHLDSQTSTAFSNACIVEKQTKIIYKIELERSFWFTGTSFQI